MAAVVDDDAVIAGCCEAVLSFYVNMPVVHASGLSCCIHYVVHEAYHACSLWYRTPCAWLAS
jgi:hypothetical protein